MHRPRPFLPLACAAVLALTACGSDGTSTATPAEGASSSASAGTSDGHGGSHGSGEVTAPGADARTATAGEQVSVTYAGGQVEGGVPTVEVPVGGSATFTVTSDVADEVHVHGADVTADVDAGGTVDVSATFEAPGEYEVELEETGARLVTVQVR